MTPMQSYHLTRKQQLNNSHFNILTETSAKQQFPFAMGSNCTALACHRNTEEDELSCHWTFLLQTTKLLSAFNL